MSAISSSTANSALPFSNSAFTYYIYAGDVQLAWNPQTTYKISMGEIIFSGENGSLHKRSVRTSNAKSEAIQTLAENIDRLDPQDRGALANALSESTHILDIPELVLAIGLKSANVNIRNHFIPLKQAEDEKNQRNEQIEQQRMEKKQQEDLRNAYQDGAFKSFYDFDNDLLSTETRIDLSINYSEAVRNALSDGEHPNHEQFAKAAADILRKKTVPDLFSSLEILIQRNNFGLALMERCLKEHPNNKN